MEVPEQCMQEILSHLEMRSLDEGGNLGVTGHGSWQDDGHLWVGLLSRIQQGSKAEW